MSFKDQRESFDPETLEALEIGFSSAWRELEANDRLKVDPVSARKALAERIIDLARKGQDPALAALNCTHCALKQVSS